MKNFRSLFFFYQIGAEAIINRFYRLTRVIEIMRTLITRLKRRSCREHKHEKDNEQMSSQSRTRHMKRLHLTPRCFTIILSGNMAAQHRCMNRLLLSQKGQKVTSCSLSLAWPDWAQSYHGGSDQSRLVCFFSAYQAGTSHSGTACMAWISLSSLQIRAAQARLPLFQIRCEQWMENGERWRYRKQERRGNSRNMSAVKAWDYQQNYMILDKNKFQNLWFLRNLKKSVPTISTGGDYKRFHIIVVVIIMLNHSSCATLSQSINHY